MNYTSSPNQRTNPHEASPYQRREGKIRLGIGYMTDAVRNQTQQTVNGEVHLVNESYRKVHPAAAMAFKEVPAYNANPVLDVNTVRASVDEARGDGRRPAEAVQADYDLSRQFLQQNPTVNTNYGYRPGESTHGSV